MLQGPNELSQRPQDQRAESNPNPQYGLHENDTQLSHQLSAGRESPQAEQATSESASGAADLDPGSETLAEPFGRLSNPTSRSESPTHTSARYERKLSKSHRKAVARQGRAENKSTGQEHLGLADLSNGGLPQSPTCHTVLIFPEILTHVLSHLPPVSLSEVSLVSRRFHELVTTPHAWRIAFSRYFPGPENLNTLDSSSEHSKDEATIRAEPRFFTRLTVLASWRSEYILRTRLLRALARGRPADFVEGSRGAASRSGSSATPVAQITYNSNLLAPITHIHATFGLTLNKKVPKFIHGADEYGAASMSDPQIGKVDSWGSIDAFAFSPRQFADVFPGDAQYGLGAGDVVGIPNVMDVSQVHGMIYGEGLVAGVLWYRSVEEKRGRALLWTAGADEPEEGIPALMDSDAVCAVWIAKSAAISELSDGLIGVLSGSSTGVLTAYTLGTNGLRDRRLERGEITARWILSPGVPLVAITVDDNISKQRLSNRRVWAVVLNALGEVFYLEEMPKQTNQTFVRRPGRNAEPPQDLEKAAWANGRTVHWKLIEPTRRIARPDPYERPSVDGSYSPRSSCNDMGLNSQQLTAETREISTFLRKKPKEFQKMCFGWDMQRRLEVDFAASDDLGAGENVLVIGCGLQEDQAAEVKRYSRCRIEQEAPHRPISTSANGHSSSSLFGGMSPAWSFENSPGSRSPSIQQNPNFIEEWRVSAFNFGGLRSPQISACAIDKSTFATLVANEDPLLLPSLSSEPSSPTSSPLAKMSTGGSVGNIPGQRARFLAVGSKTGTIFIWNMRAPVSSTAFMEGSVKPVRVIYTGSPQISCLALTALYLIHGGNDGLVQAWDPLASNMDPLRTLNSRFSSRARRRLIQAEASPAGVGINLFAAGAICLDSDPSVLRGMVSLGTHLRYWSYSSLTAENYKGKKRRARRSERGSNQSGDRFSGTGRGALKEYIANEKLELERDKRNKRKEEERLAGRFGIDLLGPGASEDEIMAYATMLSEEALTADEVRRKSTSTSTSRRSSASGDTVTEEAVGSPVSSSQLEQTHYQEDEDLAMALRLSVEDASPAPAQETATSSSIPIRYAKKKRSPTRSPAVRPTAGGSNYYGNSDTKQNASSSPKMPEADDLEYVLQLSLAEEQSRLDDQSGAEESQGKGKKRAE